MLNKIKIKNFKSIEDFEVELDSPVVFIGPNNSGKTTVLQALAFWRTGLGRWNEKYEINASDGGKTPKKRPGVTVGRRDLVAIPVPNARLLWRSLQVKNSSKEGDRQITRNVRIEITVEGTTGGKSWECGLEFDFANEESFYCRPLRTTEGENPERMPVPEEAATVDIALLPPMSGLAANEVRLDDGAIKVRVGEGRTAEVLRNLCYKIYREQPGNWQELTNKIHAFFGALLDEPRYLPDRGEIIMTYREKDSDLDISCSGRGLQQVLLLLSYMYVNPGAVLMLDEPDAHLEILRQREVYHFLTEIAAKNGNQIIAASHSEVLLKEAVERHTVVAFVGKPHRIDLNRRDQVFKSLRELGFDQYYQAEQTGWVLYLEGSTDLAILQKFAEILGDESACKALERPFVHYVRNETGKVRHHFYGLKEAIPHLKGVALFDRLDKKLSDDPNLTYLMWRKNEIENYLCFPETLERFAVDEGQAEFEGLFKGPEGRRYLEIMRESISEVQDALESLGKGSPWDGDVKVSDDFLVPLFKKYYKKLGVRKSMTKKDFYRLAPFIPKEKMDGEIKEKLAALVTSANSAQVSR